MLAELDLEALVPRVLAAARELTGAQYAALGILSDRGDALARFITSGVDAETERRLGSPPTGRGVLGELIRDAAPLRVRDVGLHPRSYGFPAGHPAMVSFLGVPLLIEGEPFGNLYLTNKQGAEEFSEEDERALVLLAAFAGVAIDHARRFTESERGRRELAQTVAALDATIQIARALGGETDLETILELVAKRGRALVSARTLVIEDRRGDELVIAAVAGEVPPGLVGEVLDVEQSVASTALRTLVTQRLEDAPNRARFERFGVGRLGLTAEAGLVVPMVFGGRAYGVLVAIDRLERGPRFGDDDQRLLEAFAASAAIALATAESADAERRRQRLAASEQERARWARELHDETLQGLAALHMRLSLGRRAGSAEAMSEAIGQALERIDDEMASLRALINDLRPAALDELGLAAALEALAERTRRADLAVDVAVRIDTDTTDSELETTMYRIVQEALTNAAKHAAATRVTVEIDETVDGVRVEVRDDGRGFDPGSPSQGFGLHSMRERSEALRGKLQVVSARDAGTTVTADLPLAGSRGGGGLGDVPRLRRANGS
jgi:signal transduction histidine kinase